VLNAIWDGVGKSMDKIKTLHYDQFSGSYNLRVLMHNLKDGRLVISFGADFARKLINHKSNEP
jgi:hypothetical protein